MKTKALFILVAVLSSMYIFAQSRVRIGYVDMDYILENVEEYRDASTQLESKVQKWKKEIEQEKNTIAQMKKDLMAEKVLLTDELIEEKEEEIQILEKEMFNYQQDRFGPEGDLVIQKRLLIQPIQDQVFNEVQKIGKNKKYDFIFDKSTDVVMLYSQKRHDISDLILRAISRTRRVSKPKNKETQKSSLEEFKGVSKNKVSDAIKERQNRVKQAEEVRTKAVEDKRAKQLKFREERKKAYEERRKKMLEDRAAKKKAKNKERGSDIKD